jgi:hypothetical protein
LTDNLFYKDHKQANLGHWLLKGALFSTITIKASVMKKVLRISAIMLLFIIAVGALAAGYSFIVEPSGKGLGISTDYLRRTAPFKNYLIPGIVLFAVNGILSAIIAVLAIKKVRHYTLLVLMQGCIYVGWIAIQVTMVTLFHPLHAIVASIGIILILIGGSLIAADYKEAVRQQYRRIHIRSGRTGSL